MIRLLDPAPQANLVWLDRIDSTNDVAERFMGSWPQGEEPELPDTVIVAGSQSGGHGRGDHAWASPPGGLYATWIAWLPNETLGGLPMAVGLACARAVEATVPGVWVGLKWPNDLYVGSCKLGGMLCHARTSAGHAWVRVGFGINVAIAPRLSSAETVRSTSLAELGWKGDARATGWALVSGFLSHIRAALSSPESTHREWVERSIHRPGDLLVVRLDGCQVSGHFVGFGPEGGLELDVDGELRRFPSGELVQPLTMGGA